MFTFLWAAAPPNVNNHNHDGTEQPQNFRGCANGLTRPKSDGEEYQRRRNATEAIAAHVMHEKFRQSPSSENHVEADFTSRAVNSYPNTRFSMGDETESQSFKSVDACPARS